MVIDSPYTSEPACLDDYGRFVLDCQETSIDRSLSEISASYRITDPPLNHSCLYNSGIERSEEAQSNLFQIVSHHLNESKAVTATPDHHEHRHRSEARRPVSPKPKGPTSGESSQKVLGLCPTGTFGLLAIETV